MKMYKYEVTIQMKKIYYGHDEDEAGDNAMDDYYDEDIEIIDVKEIGEE